MAEAQERGLVVYESRDGQEIKLSFDTVRRYLVSGKPEFVTDQEIVLYMGTCKARGLNPFKKDCYLVKYTERDAAATIVAIDYYRARAKAQPDCVGWESGIILQTDKGLEYRAGAFILEDEKLVGGWFRAKPKHWVVDYSWTVSLSGYIKKTREGVITQFWREENQAYMICKVAESQGLHRLWPDEFQGLVLDDEFAALRDVSEQPTPIRTPQALPAQPKGDPGVEGARQPLGSTQKGNDEKPSELISSNPDRGAGTNQEVSKPASPPIQPVRKAKAVPKSAPETTGEKTQEEIIAECLLWVENCTDDELHAPNSWVMQQLKLVKGTENQLKVLRPYNERRQKALTGATHAP